LEKEGGKIRQKNICDEIRRELKKCSLSLDERANEEKVRVEYTLSRLSDCHAILKGERQERHLSLIQTRKSTFTVKTGMRRGGEETKTQKRKGKATAWKKGSKETKKVGAKSGENCKQGKKILQRLLTVKTLLLRKMRNSQT